ncbi:hypothetical protein HPB50_013930 [Hyalomma asiaticum]|uniref:Uncharacterized protein n=1 Tax=Hyalomma asiaticum TaxID=266040 RepID=A0ACB7SH49_HYAAI|nr:hypothetical protein HPB50_013930 [Hyalomma asiaticum]
MGAISENLSKARQLTQSEAGGNDIAVMYDGTWQKQGHKSHNGIGTVVSLDTGLCPDLDILLNFCLAYSWHKALPDEEEEVWRAFHGPVCEQNVDCSAHAMEAAVMVRAAINIADGPSSWCKHRRTEALGEPAPDHTLLLTKAQGKAILVAYV